MGGGGSRQQDPVSKGPGAKQLTSQERIALMSTAMSWFCTFIKAHVRTTESCPRVLVRERARAAGELGAPEYAVRIMLWGAACLHQPTRVLPPAVELMVRAPWPLMVRPRS